MKLSHVAIWTTRLEEMKTFYTTYFGGRCERDKYTNPAKGFASYFIHFEGGASLEIMSRTDILTSTNEEQIGFCHIAFELGSPEQVRRQTERLREAGYRIYGEPRTTGDGFFESVVGDPDGNRVEITA